MTSAVVESKVVRIGTGERQEDLVLRPLSLRESRRWRANLDSILDEVMQMLYGLESFQSLSVDTPEGMARIKVFIGDAKGLLLNLTDKMFAALILYSPELRAREEELLDLMTDAQVVEASLAILGLIFPFGRLVNLVGPQLNQRLRSAAPPGRVRLPI